MRINTPGKDLTKEPPRSPRPRLGGYVILARTIDKCRALASGNIGAYDFDCPLDNMLFSFKAITAEQFKSQIEKGATDSDMVDWLDAHGAQKTLEEVKVWSDSIENIRPYDEGEPRHQLAPSRRWFVEHITPLGIDPKSSSLFDFLDADDKLMLENTRRIPSNPKPSPPPS